MHQAQCLTHNILNYSRKYKINRITHNFFKTQLESPNFYGVFLVFFQPPACSDLSPHLSGRNHLLLCLTPVQCDSILLITLFQTPPYIRIHILFLILDFKLLISQTTLYYSQLLKIISTYYVFNGQQIFI